MRTEEYDLAIIGGGLSCCSVLRSLLEKLATNRRHRPLSIAVIEKDNEFWTGIPYGRRSSGASLNISPLKDFLANRDRADFIQWLGINRRDLIDHSKYKGRSAGQRWVQANRHLIEQLEWDKIYLPRWIFGEYLKHKMTNAIAEAHRKNLAFTSTLLGEVTDFTKTIADKYKIVFEDRAGKTSHITASAIVLAVGSPPFMPLAPFVRGKGNAAIIEDVYSPNLDDAVEKIVRNLSRIKSARNVLILGSNATALEIIYHVGHDRRIRNVIDNIVMLSRGGMLPHRIPSERADIRQFENLASLRGRPDATASELMQAAERDVILAGASIAGMLPELIELVISSLAQMSEKEKYEFNEIYGIQFTRLIRRAGHEYRDIADALAYEGKLKLIAGSLVRLTNCKSGKISLQYKDSGGSNITHSLRFPIAINCFGFEKLGPTSASRLIRNVLIKGLCRANSTRRGFEVNERLEAGKKLFVIGPLLAGTYNTHLKCWHLEDAQRIRQLGEFVADNVLDCLSRNRMRNLSELQSAH